MRFSVFLQTGPQNEFGCEMHLRLDLTLDAGVDLLVFLPTIFKAITVLFNDFISFWRNTRDLGTYDLKV